MMGGRSTEAGPGTTPAVSVEVPDGQEITLTVFEDGTEQPEPGSSPVALTLISVELVRAGLARADLPVRDGVSIGSIELPEGSVVSIDGIELDTEHSLQLLAAGVAALLEARIIRASSEERVPHQG
jgi:hypothetical protein